ncbi:hypothetical protein AT864_02565 [Anoxybacillus sp. P3H1B]|nr:hypothetical protein AT864_02565 [Anoxybacillus sp. P3H1B]
MILPKLLKNNKDDSIIQVNKQLIFSQIHIEQYHYNDTSVTPKGTPHSSSKERSMSDGEIFFVYILGSLILTFAFLKFESTISNLILILIVLLESTFLTTSYVVTKKYCVDKSIRSILVFNTISTCLSPILLYLMKNPLKGPFVNKEEILNTISKDGILFLLSNVNTFAFLFYQAIGIIVLFLFLLFTLIGTVHILSMVNLALQNRLSKVWSWLFKKTFRFCKSATHYICVGILLLLMSFLLVSGILVSLITIVTAGL